MDFSVDRKTCDDLIKFIPKLRLTREEQLAEFDLERQNKLGKTIHRKLDTLQDHIRNKDLHLDV